MSFFILSCFERLSSIGFAFWGWFFVLTGHFLYVIQWCETWKKRKSFDNIRLFLPRFESYPLGCARFSNGDIHPSTAIGRSFNPRIYLYLCFFRSLNEQKFRKLQNRFLDASSKYTDEFVRHLADITSFWNIHLPYLIPNASSFKSMGQVIVVNAIYYSWRLKTFRQRSLVAKTILTGSIAFFYSQGLTSIVKRQDFLCWPVIFPWQASSLFSIIKML